MKLEVTRGIECGERGYGDESGHCRVRGEWNSGHCRVRGEWNSGDGCGSNRVKLRLNVEMRVSLVVVNVEISVEMVMLKRLDLLVFLSIPNFLLHILFLINLNLLFNLSFSPITFSILSPITFIYIFILVHYNL